MITELNLFLEHCTAAMTSHLQTGENFDGAVLIGVYPDNPTEVWVEVRGVRLNIALGDVDPFCRQLKRAARIAREQEDKP